MAADGAAQRPDGSRRKDDGQGPPKPATSTRLRDRVLGLFTFFYGPADHRNLPDDVRRKTGMPNEDVGDGYRRHGEPGREYVTRDDDPPR
ncbi:hypothetical protein [Pseudokineococcus sp. 1T1Z-3]|uniref:hypothetical protein n=1 Tax=Pseudokineococcus sp. 1T1Z-3 TaxID=3132745 RepID=UPI0030AD3EA4